MLEKNPSGKEDPSWQMHMQTLMKRKRNLQIAQTIDNALYTHYSEKGMNVPKWKHSKIEWWEDYLISLGIDPDNP